MNKKWIVILALLCAGAVALWWGLETRVFKKPETFEQDEFGSAETEDSSESSDGSDLSDEETEEEAKALWQQMPGLETIEEEYRKNPQATPLQIVQFAESLAPKMERALESEAKAQDFFQELSECSKNPGENGSETLRAICLANAARLAEVYPDRLESQFESLLREMPERIQLLVKSFLQ